MRTISKLCLVVFIAAVPLFGQGGRVFTGTVTDSLCGRDGHSEAMRMSKSMGTSPASCVVACVRQGAKYVLLDSSGKKLYSLSDQFAAGKFAGQEVKVTGTLAKNTIHVDNIEPQTVKPAEAPAPRQ